MRRNKVGAARFAQGGREAAPASGAPGAAPGRGQRSTPPDVEADIAAIQALRAQVTRVWPALTPAVREDLSVRLQMLAEAVESHETDSRVVRGALQEVLLIIGTGALVPLEDAPRRRLAALTGIALPVPGGG